MQSLLIFKVILHIPILKIISVLLFVFIALFILSLFFEISVKVIKVIMPILGWAILGGLFLLTGIWILRWLDLLTVLY